MLTKDMRRFYIGQAVTYLLAVIGIAIALNDLRQPGQRGWTSASPLSHLAGRVSGFPQAYFWVMGCACFALWLIYMILIFHSCGATDAVTPNDDAHYMFLRQLGAVVFTFGIASLAGAVTASDGGVSSWWQVAAVAGLAIGSVLVLAADWSGTRPGGLQSEKAAYFGAFLCAGLAAVGLVWFLFANAFGRGVTLPLALVAAGAFGGAILTGWAGIVSIRVVNAGSKVHPQAPHGPS